MSSVSSISRPTITRVVVAVVLTLATVGLLLAGVAQAATPSIASFDPTRGVEGTAVVLTGTSFTGATGVSFNGEAASFVVDSDVQISTAVPVGATTGPVSVTTPDGTGTTAEEFIVIAPPVITDFSPDGGTWRQSVAITGSRFTGVFSVQFNGTDAPFFVVSDSEISVRVPSGAGIGPIRVENEAGVDVSNTDFQFRRIRHRVVIKMHLEDHLTAIGRITLPHAGARARITCGAGRQVTILRKISGVFRGVADGESQAEGRFLVMPNDREGEYRAFVRLKRTPNRKCLPDRSPIQTHEHA